VVHAGAWLSRDTGFPSGFGAGPGPVEGDRDHVAAGPPGEPRSGSAAAGVATANGSNRRDPVAVALDAHHAVSLLADRDHVAVRAERSSPTAKQRQRQSHTTSLRLARGRNERYSH